MSITACAIIEVVIRLQPDQKPLEDGVLYWTEMLVAAVQVMSACATPIVVAASAAEQES